jgi:hypothetical protein
MNIHICRSTKIINFFTSGSENEVFPKNFITKYKRIGTPNPKEYTITTPYLTSSNLKIYSSRSQLLKYLERFPVELNKKMIVVKTQNGP